MILLIFKIKWDREGQPKKDVRLPSKVIMFDVPDDRSSEAQEGVAQSLSNTFGYSLTSYRLLKFTPHIELGAPDYNYFPKNLALCVYRPPTDGIAVPAETKSGAEPPAVDLTAEERNCAVEALLQRLDEAHSAMEYVNRLCANAVGALRGATCVVQYPELKEWTQNAAEDLQAAITASEILLKAHR